MWYLIGDCTMPKWKVGFLVVNYRRGAFNTLELDAEEVSRLNSQYNNDNCDNIEFVMPFLLKFSAPMHFLVWNSFLFILVRHQGAYRSGHYDMTVNFPYHWCQVSCSCVNQCFGVGDSFWIRLKRRKLLHPERFIRFVNFSFAILEMTKFTSCGLSTHVTLEEE